MSKLAAEVSERRSARRRTLKEGKILHAGGRSASKCVIRDLSETGAKLICQESVAVPDAFRLICVSDNVIRDSKVVWRNANEVGIVFTGEPRLAERDYSSGLKLFAKQ